MERERRNRAESDEEMYFEMDFAPSIEDLKCEDDFDDSSSVSDIPHHKPVTHNLELPTNMGQIIRSGSASIPIHDYNWTLPSTSEPSTPSNWDSPGHFSEQRTVSPPSFISRSVTDTPVSSVSPSSSFIPRILRESFSKFLHRGPLPGRVKTPDRERAGSDSECYNCEERRASDCSTVSPGTEEIVNESLRNGLPIIPFAHPTFCTASKKQEDVKKRIRKNSLKSMKRSFSEGRCIDLSEVFQEDEETHNKKFGLEDKSLDSIVRMAKQEIESIKQDKSPETQSRKESHSSYVEMNAGEALSIERTSTSDQDPYMRMEEFLENSYLHMERKKNFDPDKMFYLDQEQSLVTKQKKLPKRKNNWLHKGKDNGELLMQESLARQYKRGNKHKDDYVFFDFEQNKDYVDMGKAKTKKWQFFDFKGNK
eukprot:GFUD01008482.1.p1 GENE.GFUD01008482.1~~GFUD01008482.1.p1  ORF type:complete len:423 (-),score=109.98 GFUD01008482.1:42-1310(-)